MPNPEKPKLISAEKLLADLFPADCRPSLRTLKRWQKARVVPHYKIGFRVYFVADEVREKLEKKNLIRAI